MQFDVEDRVVFVQPKRYKGKTGTIIQKNSTDYTVLLDEPLGNGMKTTVYPMDHHIESIDNVQKLNKHYAI